ncbi:MAG: DUF3179 domain-containing protein [Bacteroidota bacterium]
MSINLQKVFWLSLVVLIGCKEDIPPPVEQEGPLSTDWLIPLEEVIDAGVGMDGIPSVDTPMFSQPFEINSAFDDNLVLGIEHEGEVRAYPIPMLNWHEIVNDDVNGLLVAITYCPLTGTGIGWGRRIFNFPSTFGVSGFLFNTNLMPYDRFSRSTWSQQRLECVHGNMIGSRPLTYTLTMTTFRSWKQAFPNSKIMNANTGFDRRYSEYPYGFYRSRDELLYYPVSNLDTRLPAKEWVLAVLMHDHPKAYQFNEEKDGTEIIPDVINDTSLLIVRSKRDHYIVAFLPSEEVEFTAIQDGLPAIMSDEKGNIYDLLGRVIDGPDKGMKLAKPVAMMGYWFSWGSFYPEIEIY